MRHLVLDDAGAANLGAGAGGGGDRDHRQNPRRIGAPEVVANVLERPQRPVLEGGEGHRLAGVEGRAAAKGDDPVRLVVAQGAAAGLHVPPGRVPGEIAEHADLQAGGAHRAQRRFHHGMVGEAPVGHQQRPGDPGDGAGGGQLDDPPGAKAD